MRYFANEDFDGNLRELFRFQVNESGLQEHRWTPEGRAHDEDAEIVAYLALGDGDLTEITEDVARAHKPDAFNSDLANTVLPRTPGNAINKPIFRKVQYRVIFLGSSLVGFSYDYDAYKAAEEFLQGRSDQGRAKCFHWWCKTCTEKPLAKGESPIGHVIEVSIPNVLAISEGYKVDWHWEDPDSEWAKSRGTTAAEEFQSLVDRKSWPNWKVILQQYV